MTVFERTPPDPTIVRDKDGAPSTTRLQSRVRLLDGSEAIRVDPVLFSHRPSYYYGTIDGKQVWRHPEPKLGRR